jgi:CRISPR-associated endonuclease/helicase Cas3
LIRDVMQVQLLIHNAPKEEITSEPWRWQSFGLHPGSLQGQHWNRLRAMQGELDLGWMCKKAVPLPVTKDDEEEDSRQVTSYNWDDIKNSAEIPNTLMIAMPNQLVTYDQRLGLVFLDERLELPESWQRQLAGSTYQSQLREHRSTNTSGEPAGRMQSYQQHIAGLAQAYHYTIRHELAYAITHLEQLMELEPGTIDHAIQLAIATHDLGKLDEKWQRWARAWQRLLAEKTNWAIHYQEPKGDYFFAKTDRHDPYKEESQWQTAMREKRPRHACESVMIGRRLLMHILGIISQNSPNMPVLRAICSAIAHHHSPTAQEYGVTRVSARAQAAIEGAIQAVRLEGDWGYDLSRLNLAFSEGKLSVSASMGMLTQPNVAAGPEELLETWLAFLMVRALRLADQRADLYSSYKMQ